MRRKKKWQLWEWAVLIAYAVSLRVLMEFYFKDHVNAVVSIGIFVAVIVFLYWKMDREKRRTWRQFSYMQWQKISLFKKIVVIFFVLLVLAVQCLH